MYCSISLLAVKSYIARITDKGNRIVRPEAAAVKYLSFITIGVYLTLKKQRKITKNANIMLITE